MQKFIFAIEEIAVQEFSLYANDAEEAFEFVEQKYKSGEFVLEPGVVTFKQMALIEPCNERTEWVMF